MNNKSEDFSKRIWIYNRVANNQSKRELEKQKDELIAFSTERGYTIIGVSGDIGSGKDYEREGLKEMIEASDSRKFDIILVRSLSSIGRDLFNTYKVLELLKSKISAIISPIEGVMQISTILQSFKAQMEVKIDNESFNTDVIYDSVELEFEESGNLQFKFHVKGNALFNNTFN